MDSAMLPVLLNPQETAEAIGVTVTTLAVWRCTKRYALHYIKAGRLIRYRQIDVAAFLDSRLVKIRPIPERAPASASRQQIG